MKNKTHMPVLRKIFWKIILIVGGVLLCILFVAITVVWSLTDYIFRKLEREV
jgi:vancomycin permeability regulator SanA